MFNNVISEYVVLCVCYKIVPFYSMFRAPFNNPWTISEQCDYYYIIFV